MADSKNKQTFSFLNLELYYIAFSRFSSRFKIKLFSNDSALEGLLENATLFDELTAATPSWETRSVLDQTKPGECNVSIPLLITQTPLLLTEFI